MMSNASDKGWEFLDGVSIKKRRVPSLPRTVGYGKPPKSAQFKKGESGNPKGRPRKSRNQRKLMHDLALEKLESTIIVKENGVRKKMSMMEVIINRLMQSAANGDKKALDYIRALDKEKLVVQEKEKGSRGGVLVVPGFIPAEVSTAEMEVQQQPYREKWPLDVTAEFHKELYRWREDFYMRNRDRIRANPVD